MSLGRVLNLKRSLLLFDLETTGAKPDTDRIVELAFLMFNPDGSDRFWRSLVDPEMPIPAGATEKHGITDARIKACRVCGQAREDHQPNTSPCDGTLGAFVEVPTFAQLAPSLLRGFTNCDYAGFNVKTFDLPCLLAEFTRTKHPWSYADARIVDGYRLWQVAEPRTLSDFVRVMAGRDLVDAHQAEADVRGTAEGLLGLFEKFPTLPRDLDVMHAACWPKNPDAIDPDGKLVWKNGVATMNFGKNWIGKPLHLMTRKDLTWISGPDTSFSPELKAIIRDALAGRLPKQPTLPQEPAA